MRLGNLLVFFVSALLVLYTFLPAPLQAQNVQTDCVEWAKTLYAGLYGIPYSTAPGSTAFHLQQSTEQLFTLNLVVPNKLNELEAAINAYNASPSRAAAEFAWTKLRDAEASLEDFRWGMLIGRDHVLTPCMSALSDSLFNSPATAAIRSEFNNAVGPTSGLWIFLEQHTARLENLRRNMPSYLFFGNFEYPLPGITGTIDQFVNTTNPILRYVNIVFIFVIAGIVGIALISIVVAGYMYVTAGGDAQKVATAKSLIGAALLGIVLALGAFLILNTIGTQFASGLREPSLTP